MPSHPCPHCGVKFANAKNLATHVRYNHAGPQQPSGPDSMRRGATGFLATVKASRQQAEEAAIDDGDLGAGSPGRQPGDRTAGASAEPSLWDEGYAAPPPEMAGMMGSFSVQLAPPPGPPPTTKPSSSTPTDRKAHAKGGKSASGQPASAIRGGVKTFTVVFECSAQNVRTTMKIPHDERFDDFLERMRQASIPVAGAYMSGRTTGFTLADGTWRYALVDRKRVRDVENGLGSTLLYLAMVSELVKAWSQWDHVVVWHEKQKVEASMSVGEQAAPRAQIQSSSQHPTQRTNLLGPTSSASARQPVSILDSATEYSTTRYLVQWMDGPSTWELASVLGDDSQWLIDAYQTEVDKGGH